MKILPLFIPHQGCPFDCIYCDQKLITGGSNPDLERFSILIAQFCCKNPERDKEIAYFGGTFTALEREQQLQYLQIAGDHCDEIRGFRISTRPDYIDSTSMEFLKDNRVTTIELGIQSFSDEVLLKSGRGYDCELAVKACKLVQGSGFDLIIQLMPGLPGDDRSVFFRTIEQVTNIHPAGVRLYPTLVLKGTALERMFFEGRFEPVTLDETIEWLSAAYRKLQEKDIAVLKMGLHSDLKPDKITAGPFHPALGELVRIEIAFAEIKRTWEKGCTLEIAHNMISLFRGHGNLLLNKLKNYLLLDKIPVRIIKEKNAAPYVVSKAAAKKYW